MSGVFSDVSTITPDGPGNEAWKIYCESGTVSQPGAPGLTITDAELRYQRPSLFITDASLRYDVDSSIALSGEVDFDKGFDVQAKPKGIPVTPFLAREHTECRATPCPRSSASRDRSTPCLRSTPSHAIWRG